MRVAGVGFRAAATAEEITAALAPLGRLDALATLPAKAAALRAAVAPLGLPVRAVEVAGVPTPTRAPRILAAHGTGSVAEAAALVAAGPGARLAVPRCICPGGVTVALALSEGETE